MNNTCIEDLLFKGAYFYSSPIISATNGKTRESKPKKPPVYFNLLIVYGDKPTVQILPDTYTKEYVKDRMEGKDFVFVVAQYQRGELHVVGEVQ